MSNLFTAANTGTARTWNGMKTNVSSMDTAVDLFYKIGAARGKFETITSILAGAVSEEKDAAIRILLWSRDVREGAGERQTFRDAINFLAVNELLTLDEARRIMKKVPELGRWDDLSIFVDTGLELEALATWMEAVQSGNGLAAKWAPRKGLIAAKLRKVAGLSPKAYRKLLVANSATVEQAMCAKDWDNINFSHVPSMAANRYQKAFFRNAPENYEAYKAELVKPEADRDPKVKINANAIYPYDIIKSIHRGDATVASEQWKALPNFMEGSQNAGIIPIVDVSGSMCAPAGGVYKPNAVTCLDVAISLGLYISERNTGPFKDEFITFSSSPEMVKTTGDLKSRVHQMNTSAWRMSTNVIAAFKLILNAGMKAKLPEEDMPKTLLILSDMQFNQCVTMDDSAMEAVTKMYREAGYERPNIVFWNINSSGEGVPTSADAWGTALVSGFSPSIMASILKADDFTPRAMMERTIMQDRYNW